MLFRSPIFPKFAATGYDIQMIRPCPIPGLFITGTDTGVGKTVIAGAIAQWFVRRSMNVAVCKPVATGCQHQREGLVSEDAEFLASASDSRHPLDMICPVRFHEALCPAVAAERADEEIDWPAIDQSIHNMSVNCSVMIIEGVGGVMVPISDTATVLHLANWLQLPTLVVARPGLGTINHTLLTISALQAAGVAVAGIIVNQYPSNNATIVEETNLDALEKFSGVPVLAVVPFEKVKRTIPVEIADAIDRVDWTRLAMRRMMQ